MQRIKNLSWKQKNRLLFAGLLLSGWIIYSYAISNTLEARSMCKELEAEIASASEAPKQIEQLQMELNRLNALTGKNEAVTMDSSAHEQLLNLVTVYCDQNSLTLRDFSSPIIYTTQEWLVETHPFTVEGNFIGIVQLIEHLRNNTPGKVVSADIHSKKDNKTKTTSLLVTIYIQNISTKSA